MKVCHIGLEIIPSEMGKFYGGLSNNVSKMTFSLNSFNVQNTIITSDSNNAIEKTINIKGTNIIPIKSRYAYNSPWFGFDFLIKVSRILLSSKKSEYDILHIHSAYPLFGLTSIFSSIPTVFTLYSPVLSELGGRGRFFKIISNPFFTRLYLLKPRVIITLSNNIKKSLISLGVKENKIIILPPVIDTNIFNPYHDEKIKRIEHQIENTDFLILYCGNWTPWKGVDVLIESIKEIMQSHTNIKLILAFGEKINWQNQTKNYIDELISKYDLKKNITEIGFTNEMELYMAACDVFVAPFRDTREVADIPLSILEAMATAKPVIASNVGGIPEIITDNVTGLLVEPEDPKGLANKIVHLLENKDIGKKIGEKAHNFVKENYSANFLSKKLFNIYEDLLR